MDDGYVIVRLGAIRDLLSLAANAAFELETRGSSEALARCLRGASAEVISDLAEPVFS